jgi:hypothetical protein
VDQTHTERSPAVHQSVQTGPLDWRSTTSVL